MEEQIIQLKKIERQLILYKYFSSPCIKEKTEAMSLYGIPTSTIYKDMADLRDAGLVSIEYNEAGREYVRSSREKSYDATKDKPTRVRHLARLKRLAWCMDNLSNDPTTYEYEYEDPMNPDNDNHTVVFDMGKKSCKDCYFQEFPGLSISTMQRDFKILSRIGYPIKYNFVLQKYDFL